MGASCSSSSSATVTPLSGAILPSSSSSSNSLHVKGSLSSPPSNSHSNSTRPLGRRRDSIFRAIEKGNSSSSDLCIPIELLDENGYLKGTDFDIDPSRCDAENEEHWREYVERRRRFDVGLRELYAKMNRRKPLKLPENITYIRPFLSSTFKDFNEERNICFAGTFPRLEKLCNDRGIFFAPLDLRWGVTSEQSGSGQVIKICLEEIDRSRPYFVCSLGFRNGWTLYPTDNPDDQYVKLLKKTFELGIQAFPWIEGKQDRSVTELEILHGALNQPELAARAYFYMRTIQFLESLPKEKRKLFCEIGEAEKKLQSLQLSIVLCGFKVKYFTAPQEMADKLEEDLRESIEEDFPAQKLTALDRELKDHQAFVDMRTRVYVGGDTLLQQLDAYITGDSSEPFVIKGGSGTGKSSLLSNWMKRLKERIKHNQMPGKKHTIMREGVEVEAPDDEMSKVTPLLHWNISLIQDRYIGSTSDSATPASLIRWMLQEIKNKFDYIEQSIPTENKKLMEEWPDWLELASSSSPLLIVLDGLDQLVEDDDSHQLHWLPSSFPKNVRVVVSCVSESEVERVLSSRGYRGINVDLLSSETTLQLIRDYLGSYGKKLDHEQEQRIVACERTRNPLYLITFLQEVRVFGSYENLNKRIDHYMEAKNISEMFAKVIQRLEEDFEPNTPGLVKHTLCLLLQARRGLNEPELKGSLELALHVSAVNKSFPNMEFSALMLRLDQQLVDQRGLRKFSHNYMRTAVESKYFSSREQAIEAHQCLADYFASIPVSDRKVEEQPWHIYTILQYFLQQQIQANNGSAGGGGGGGGSPITHSLSKDRIVGEISTLSRQLQECLVDLSMFDILHREFKYDLHKYWLLLEQSKHQHNLAISCYTESLKEYNKKHKPQPIPFAELAEDIGTFLISTDRYMGADVFLDQALAVRQKVQDPEHPEIELLLSKKANLFYRQGRYEEALTLYRQAMNIVEKHEGQHSVRSSVLRTSIAGLLKEQGKYEESQPLYEQSLRDKIQLLGPKHAVVATSMANLADLHLRMFKPEKALPLYEQALQIMESERGRNHPEVATILSSLASCYMQVKKYEESIRLYERARKIKEDVYGANHISVAVVLNNLAATYHSQGDHTKALKLYERSLKIRQQAHGKESPLLVATLNNMGLIYTAEQKWRTALTFFNQALNIQETQLGKNHVDLVSTLNSISKIHVEEKKYDSALSIYLRELDILESHYGLEDERIQQSLNNVGMVYQSMDNFARALPYHVRELKITEKRHGERSAKASEVLMILGVVLASIEGCEEDAINIFKRCYLIRKALLGETSESTQEAKDWLNDLSEEGEGDDPKRR